MVPIDPAAIQHPRDREAEQRQQLEARRRAHRQLVAILQQQQQLDARIHATALLLVAPLLSLALQSKKVVG